MSSFGVGLTLLPHGVKNYLETSGIHQYVDPAGSKRVNFFFRELESGCGCAGGALAPALQGCCHETSHLWLLELVVFSQVLGIPVCSLLEEAALPSVFSVGEGLSIPWR